MTSGVYQLIFASKRQYIGKSIDIETRWQQHWDKLAKGTASKLMQQEFYQHGDPVPSVLFECHPDHIDLVEACCIARLQPELNTSRPSDPFQGIDDLQSIFELLGVSTLQHVNQIHELSAKYLQAETKAKTLETKVTKLMKKRSDEELTRDTQKRIEMLNTQLEQARKDYAQATMQLKYYKLPWWERIFS